MPDMLLVVETSNKDINTKVNEIMMKHNGRVPLKMLSRMVKARFEYNPLSLYRVNDPQVDIFKKSGFKVYNFREGIIYEPTILISDKSLRYV